MLCGGTEMTRNRDRPDGRRLTRYLCSLSKQQKSSKRNVLSVNDTTTSAVRSSLARVLNARRTFDANIQRHVSSQHGVKLEKLLTHGRQEDASTRPPNLSLASYDLDL